MLQDILKDFEEKFVYDYFDNTGLEILGERVNNRPASDSDIKHFITHTYNITRKEVVEEILREMPVEDEVNTGIVAFENWSNGYNSYREQMQNLLNKKI